jgi:quercetin dioxygenase-like cupin family protein
MTTRHVGAGVIAALVLVAGVGHQSRPAAQQGGFTRTLLLDEDLSVPMRHVVQARAAFEPGITSGRHTHPGEEVGYVLEGEIELLINGRPSVTVKAGESFLVPAGAIHEGRTAAAQAATVLATYIVEKGKPVSNPVK